MSGHNSNQGRAIRVGLTDAQRDDLTRLEQVDAVTDFDKGALRALRLCSTQVERDRVERLQAKWGTR